jgi:para-aminobenzoate synthetase component 1
MQPLVKELLPPPSPSEALQALSDLPNVILFESARPGGRLGRYSYLSAVPISRIVTPRAEFGHGPDRLEQARALLSHSKVAFVPELPPFQGGVAGFLGYEFGHCFERIARPAADEFQLPDAWIGLYTWVLAWDHQQARAWIISQQLFHDTPEESRIVARNLIDSILDRLSSPTAARSASPERPGFKAVARQYAVPGHGQVTSDFSPDGYQQSVRRVIDYIHAGDVFQANLSQRLLAPWDGTASDLYLKLRDCNPAPFAGYLAADDWAIVSASPERFVRVEDGQVETRPIKGTRQRRSIPEADLFTRDELRESEKDIAENVMIVDLLRNDLSRVCQPGSISVPQLCVVESYETVQHLVSEICGTLADGEDAWSLLAAAFPGGSITGAPKVRAMEIIAELEPTVRGPYCGSLFYAGFNGSFDSSILIRTFVLKHGIVQCSVGGGIVAQSDPLAEYEETMHKAEGMLRVFD